MERFTMPSRGLHNYSYEIDPNRHVISYFADEADTYGSTGTHRRLTAEFIDRLGEYEDTGLTPLEIHELALLKNKKSELDEKCKKLEEINKHLSALVKLCLEEKK